MSPMRIPCWFGRAFKANRLTRVPPGQPQPEQELHGQPDESRIVAASPPAQATSYQTSVEHDDRAIGRDNFKVRTLFESDREECATADAKKREQEGDAKENRGLLAPNETFVVRSLVRPKESTQRQQPLQSRTHFVPQSLHCLSLPSPWIISVCLALDVAGACRFAPDRCRIQSKERMIETAFPLPVRLRMYQRMRTSGGCPLPPAGDQGRPDPKNDIREIEWMSDMRVRTAGTDNVWIRIRIGHAEPIRLRRHHRPPEEEEGQRKSDQPQCCPHRALHSPARKSKAIKVTYERES